MIIMPQIISQFIYPRVLHWVFISKKYAYLFHVQLQYLLPQNTEDFQANIQETLFHHYNFLALVIADFTKLGSSCFYGLACPYANYLDPFSKYNFDAPKNAFKKSYLFVYVGHQLTDRMYMQLSPLWPPYIGKCAQN